MMRSAVFIVSVFCVATVLTEVLGVAYLWFNGQLSPAAIHDIRVALGAEEVAKAQEGNSEDTVAKSYDDIVAQRTIRVWDLQRRLQEVRILMSTVTEKAAALKTDRETLEQIQKDFKQQLAVMKQDLNGEAVEQARAILLKMEPADAVSNLMPLTVKQNVVLLKGMPDKSIAAILQELLRGNDPKKVERERQIFEAISKGEPSRKLIDDAVRRAGGNAEPPVVPMKAAN